MIGLIKKDLLMIKSNIKVLSILFVVYGYMAFQGEMSLSFLLPFMSVMIMISTFSYDAYNKWDAYAITLPGGRKNSVRAKYLATILLIMVTTIITTIISLVIFYYQNNKLDFENIVSNILGAIFATTLLQSIMYPAIYKFGVENARIGIFVVVFVTVIIGGILAKFINFEFMLKTLDGLDDLLMLILPLIMIVMLYLSYKISEGIYKRKEY